jgi:hypothetical protein
MAILKFDPNAGFVSDEDEGSALNTSPSARAVATTGERRYGIFPGSTPSTPENKDGSFVRGMKGSLIGLKEAGYGVARYVGDAVGSEGVQEFGREGYEKAHAEQQANSRESDSFSSAFIDGNGSKADWAAYWAGYAVSELVQAVATGGLGSAIFKGMAKKGVEKLATRAIEKEAALLAGKNEITEEVAKQAAVNVAGRMGAVVGMGSQNFGKELGAIYNEAAEGGDVDLAKIAGAAAMAAALDTVSDKFAVGKLMKGGGTGGITRRVAGGAASTGAMEGLTEFGQTIIEKWGANAPQGAEHWREYLDATMAGVMGGGFVGGVASIRPSRADQPTEPERDPATETRDLTDTTVATSNQPGAGRFATQGQTAEAVNDPEAADIAANEPPAAGGVEELEPDLAALRAPQRDFQRAQDELAAATANAAKQTAPGSLPVDQLAAKAANDVPVAPPPPAVKIGALGEDPVGTVVTFLDPNSAMHGQTGVITSPQHIWIGGATFELKPTARFAVPGTSGLKNIPPKWTRLTEAEIADLIGLRQQQQTPPPPPSVPPAASPPVPKTPKPKQTPSATAPVAVSTPETGTQQTATEGFPAWLEEQFGVDMATFEASDPKDQLSLREQYETSKGIAPAAPAKTAPRPEPFGVWAMEEHGIDTAGLAKLDAKDRAVLDDAYGEYVAALARPATPAPVAHTQPNVGPELEKPDWGKPLGKVSITVEGRSSQGHKRRLEVRVDGDALKGALLYDQKGKALGWFRGVKDLPIKEFVASLDPKFFTPDETIKQAKADKVVATAQDEAHQENAARKRQTALDTKLERLKEKLSGEPANITPEQARTAEIVEAKDAKKRDAEITKELKALIDAGAIDEQTRFNAEMAENYGLARDSFEFVEATEPLTKAKAAVIERIFPVRVQFIRPLNDQADDLAEGFFLPRLSEETIYISVNTQNPFLFVAGHEFAHSIKKRAPKLWAEFVARVSGVRIEKQQGKRRVVRLAQDNEGGKFIDVREFEKRALALENTLRAKLQDAGMPQPGKAKMAEVIVEEMYADLVGSMLMRPAFIERLSLNSKPELKSPFAKLLRYLNDFLADLKAKITSRGLRGGRAFKDTVELERVVADMLTKFADIRDPNMTNVREDAKAFWAEKSDTNIPYGDLSEKLRERWEDSYNDYREGDLTGSELMREIDSIEQIHEANVRADRASQAVNKPDDDDDTPPPSRPRKQETTGINLEVAPNPDDKALADRFAALPMEQRDAVTKAVSLAVLPKVAKLLGLPTPGIDFVMGGFEGGSNPAMIVRLDNVTAEQRASAAEAMGYVLSQKAAIAYDEDAETGEDIVGFVRVTPDRQLSSEEVNALYLELRAAVPEADGYTFREGSLVFGNFSSLEDNEFLVRIARALTNASVAANYTATPKRFQSKWIGVTYGEQREGGSGQAGREVPGRQGRLDSLRAEAAALLEEQLSVAEDEVAGNAPRLSPKASVPTNGNKTLESGLRKVGANKPEQTLPARIREVIEAHTASDLKQGIFDRFSSIKGYDTYAYVLARMSGSTDGTLVTMLTDGRPVMDNDGALDVDHSGGVLNILKQLEGEQDRYLAWVAGNRAKRLKGAGLENNLADPEIDELRKLNQGNLPSGKARTAVYAKVLSEMNAMNQAVLDIAVRSGLIGAQTAQTFKQDAYYVPFYREMEDGDFEGASKVASLVGQQPFHKMKGRNKATNDLLENVLMNWSAILSASMKNQAAVATLHAAAQPQFKATHRVQAGTKDAVKVMVSGRAEHWAIDDPMLLASLRSMQPSTLGWAAKALAKSKEWFTKGVTLSPGFKVRNLVRDAVSALALAPMGYNPLTNIAEGFALTGDKRLSATMLAGGASFRFGAFNDGNQAAMVRELVNMGVDPGTILTTPDKMVAAFKNAVRKYQEAGDRFENANRATLYKRLRDDGVSHLEASFLARDLMDFSLTGAYPSVRFLVSVVPFLNARLQGLYKLGRAGAEDKARVAAVTGAVMMASVLLYLSNKDDEEFQKRERWDRDNFWWFRFGDTAFRIPKPFEIGAVGTLAERMVEQMVDGSAEGKQFGESLYHVLMDTFSFNPVPQLVKPVWEVYADKDSFSGREIEGDALKRLPKQDRYTDRNTQTARAVAGATAVANQMSVGLVPELSPAQVDHMARGYFGWVGMTAMSAADLMLRPLSGQGERPDAKGGMAEEFLGWMGMKGLMQEVPADQSRFVSAFYEQHQELKQLATRIKQLRDLGDDERADKLEEANEAKVDLAKGYGKVAKQMSKITLEIKRVIADKEMGGAEKRKELDALYAERAELAKEAEMERLAAR